MRIDIDFKCVGLIGGLFIESVSSPIHSIRIDKPYVKLSNNVREAIYLTDDEIKDLREWYKDLIEIRTVKRELIY